MTPDEDPHGDGGPTSDDPTGDDDHLAERLRAKMTELRARQALLRGRPGRTLDDLAVRLDDQARLLELNTRILEDHTRRLQTLHDLLRSRPTV